MRGSLHVPANSGKTADLFQPPKNVAALTAAGAEFHWRKSAADIIGLCPFCQGKLVLHESEPWALCVGQIHCRAGQLPFGELLAEIARNK
jgi:hypothetical protein